MSVSAGRVLMISPAFFGYAEAIAEAMRGRGWTVDLFDERPSNRAAAKAVMRVAPALAGPMLTSHYRAMLGRVSGIRYDGIVIVKGEAVPPAFLEELRRRNPGARVVHYAYDSLVNTPSARRLWPHVDARYSFDPQDVAAERGLRYKPLFYTDEFFAPGAGPRRRDVSFVGTLHSGRHAAVRTLTADFPRRHAFFYVHARWYFLVQRHITRRFAGIPARDVSHVPMSRADVASVFRDSHAVLDFPRPDQAGLTMRTFEVLASGAVLVTTNRSVSSAPFHSRDHVILADPERPERTIAALRERLDAGGAPGRAPAGFTEHSVGEWCRELLPG